MPSNRLIRGFMTVGLWTMLSRVLGFVRDIFIAAALGAGPVADAFVVAFALPNMFRRFFAEGAFNTAFVPMFSKKVEAQDEARAFAQDALTGLSFVLIIFTVISIFAMPWLVLAMASGFAGDARFDLTVLYGRIAFPYILFISIAALLSGVLNALGRFVAAAAAPVLLNVMFVAILSFGLWQGWDPGLTLVWTIPFAGVAQMALLWVAARRAGFTLLPRRPKWTPELRRLAIIAAPAALAGGVVQVNLLVGRQVASYFEGANAWLYYADRLYQLPLGVVGIAIGIVLLPDLSRKLQADDTLGGQQAISRAGEICLALTVPAAVALIVIPDALVSVLFERGAFSETDSAATALACAIYGLGLPAFVLQKVLQPLFFAREDTRSPFRYALVAMVVNAGIAIGLAPVIGFIAAAWGATLAGWAMVALLWFGSRGMGDAAQPDTRFWDRSWRIILASLVMGAVLWGADAVLHDILRLPTWRYLALAALIAIGGVAYAVAGQALRAFTLSELKGSLRRSE
ncbi:murein biosynthesis integral membrane protein MurJ [Shimia ponticola]|uniref:murein biosynthesis integral membrane protein MurJ n=1 Tax=Shimia ponticola TaxID=2582893 RepID=UPI0011BEF496|nr:murein biosynthesis integral membrane protein MurJ [Shimia ponticola]